MVTYQKIAKLLCVITVMSIPVNGTQFLGLDEYLSVQATTISSLPSFCWVRTVDINAKMVYSNATENVYAPMSTTDSRPCVNIQITNNGTTTWTGYINSDYPFDGEIEGDTRLYYQNTSGQWISLCDDYDYITNNRTKFYYAAKIVLAPGKKIFLRSTVYSTNYLYIPHRILVNSETTTPNYPNSSVPTITVNADNSQTVVNDN